MKVNSMTVTFAHVAEVIDKQHAGMILKDELLRLLGEHGVHQEAIPYVGKMLDWGWVYYDDIMGSYHLTTAATQTAVISVRVPRLNAKEVRNDIVQHYARYEGMISVGEVENDAN